MSYSTQRAARQTPDEPTAPSHGRSIAARVTAQIIEALRQGTRPWQQPWSSSAALALPLRHNGSAYRGTNVLVLWAMAQRHSYTARYWLSFKQARELNGCVRRSERATHVVYYSGATHSAGDERDVGPNAPKRRSFLKTYAVFNACQIDGLPAHFYAAPEAIAESDDTGLAEIFARVPAEVRAGGGRACYNATTDVVYMPARAAFNTTALYYATLSHELAHWTGHASRLDRSLVGPANVAGYAGEELIAELCAAFLGAELGLPVDHLECHAAYIDHWIGMLDRDPGALMTSAAKAQVAADYLRAFFAVDGRSTDKPEPVG